MTDCHHEAVVISYCLVYSVRLLRSMTSQRSGLLRFTRNDGIIFYKVDSISCRNSPSSRILMPSCWAFWSFDPGASPTMR